MKEDVDLTRAKKITFQKKYDYRYLTKVSVKISVQLKEIVANRKNIHLQILPCQINFCEMLDKRVHFEKHEDSADITIKCIHNATIITKFEANKIFTYIMPKKTSDTNYIHNKKAEYFAKVEKSPPRQIIKAFIFIALIITAIVIKIIVRVKEIRRVRRQF